MKTPTIWSGNPSSEANEYPYDSATLAYDSSSQNYDGVVDTDLSDNELQPTVWGFVNKQPTSWMADTSDLYPYDSADIAYDEDRNYDGSVDTTRKTPTQWSNS